MDGENNGNPIKMDDLGGTIIFGNIHMIALCWFIINYKSWTRHISPKIQIQDNDG